MPLGIGYGKRRGSAGGYLGIGGNRPGFSRMVGEGDEGLFNVVDRSELPGTRAQVGGTGRPGRQMTSTSVASRNAGPRGVTMRNEAHIDKVLSTRRANKLAAADPGLSNRGRINAPGRAARPVTGGLEGRGVRPESGTRMRPAAGPRGGLLAETVRQQRAAEAARQRRLPVKAASTRGQRTSGPTVRGGAARPHGFTGPGRGLALRGETAVVRPGGSGATGGVNSSTRSITNAAGKTNSTGPGRFSGIKGMMKSKNFKRNALIGAGVVAAASVVQSRRGDGTSKGRQSNYRY